MIELRPRSFEVLAYLVGAAGRAVSKDELLASVWPGVVVTEDSLTRCISDIRQALGDDGQRIIKTLPRRGYVFVAALQPTGDGVEFDTGRPTLATRWRHRPWVVAVALALATAAGLAVWQWGGAPTAARRDCRSSSCH